jgi:16S rRNA (guanine527-N7)-methyltransferase
MEDIYSKLTQVFLEKNQQINLSSIRTQEWVEQKHIQDSLMWLELLKKNDVKPEKAIDVWTWWGFPLLPLAIATPEIKRTWLDSVRKKTIAVQDIADQLWLQNITMTWSRAEDHPQRYDLVTARAVAIGDKLIWLIKHLVRKNGYVLLYKLDTDQEDQIIKKCIKKYAFTIVDTVQYDLWDETPRILYLIRLWNLTRSAGLNE